MTGRIFINYRRGDEPGFAGRLFDRLEQAFTSDRLFMDVDHIGPGQDFVRVLEDEVGKCDVLLAVIGKGWMDASDEAGNKRLDSANDFVRIEIESALKYGKRLIPVLVNDAQMPRGDDLPDTMKPLSRRNAVRLTHERFKSDAQGLIKILETALAEVEAARALRSEEERKAAEDALKRKQEDEVARAAEAERQAQQRAHQQAAQGLSPEEIRKAEELANWDFIKAANDTTELRNHLARFPGGVTERYARTALEEIVWNELGTSPDLSALEAFAAEFPNGRHVADASSRLGFLKGKADAERDAAELKRRETEAWAKASSEDTQEAYNDFIAQMPQSQHAKAARLRIRELDRAGSSSLGSKLALAGSVATVVALGTWLLLSETEQRQGTYFYCSQYKDFDTCQAAPKCTWEYQGCTTSASSEAEAARESYRQSVDRGVSTPTPESAPQYVNTAPSRKDTTKMPSQSAIQKFCARTKSKGACEVIPTCSWTKNRCNRKE